MAGYNQPMAPGPIQYKRKYTLWVLILLVIVCWPVAIIYYFTRDKVPVQEFQAYGSPTQGQPAYAPTAAPAASGTPTVRFCAACGAPAGPSQTFCAKCGKPLSP